MSPAYDLTYSSSLGGEHATTINGNGRDPGLEDILAVAKRAGMNLSTAEKTAKEIREIVEDDLEDYLDNTAATTHHPDC